MDVIESTSIIIRAHVRPAILQILQLRARRTESQNCNCGAQWVLLLKFTGMCYKRRFPAGTRIRVDLARILHS